MAVKKVKTEGLARTLASDNKVLSLNLPIPTSINHMYYNTRSGGKRLTKTAENYVRDSRAIINQSIDEQHWKKVRDSTWLYVDIIVYMPDRRIRDSHNMLKLLMDVMQGIVFENDYYAMPRIQSVEYRPNNPGLEIIISKQSNQERLKVLDKN